jgi:hypothetical protein
MLLDQSPLGKGSSSPGEPENRESHALRNSWIIFGIIMAVLSIYTALVFYSRREENRQLLEQAARKQRESDAQTVEMMGGNEFKILSFYAAPGHLRRGQATNLCYGVSNAKSVVMDPPLKNIYPAYSNCVRISPRVTTTYTLTATDAQGHTEKQSLTIEVK